MGFMDSLKSAASSFVKSIRHKTFKIRAEELAEKWEKLRHYGVEIEAESRYGGKYSTSAWFVIEDVSAKEVEVGIIRKSRKKKITVKCYREIEPYDEYEEEEEGGWFDYRREEDTIERRELTLWEGDRVKIRMTEANYERLVEREGQIV
ncbi:hypothetical protein [Thermococcus sp.]|uniref:hypothetical protein n=1 Tax=Thermococcus sp. TaxID=35749 RepID=UPI002621E383|nr:hypothetical protein [Thermococcus sp.]